MGSADEVQVMTVEKLADHVGPEGEGDPAVILSPALYILIWVRPQEVTQQACIRHICWPHDPADLLH